MSATTASMHARAAAAMQARCIYVGNAVHCLNFDYSSLFCTLSRKYLEDDN
jgi:hypothetical protein